MTKRSLLILPALLCMGTLYGCASDNISQAAVLTESATPSPAEQTDYIQAYIDKIHESEKDTENLKYELIHLDEDKIPELVTGVNGYFVNIYTYSSGQLYTIADQWPYGAMGNNGYEYIPYQNVIRNYNADLAGAIMYVSYEKVNEKHEVESYYEEALSSWMFEDKNHNYMVDEDEPVGEEAFYYYGDREITEEDFNSYLKEGDYQAIEGDKSAEEMIQLLQALSSPGR